MNLPKAWLTCYRLSNVLRLVNLSKIGELAKSLANLLRIFFCFLCAVSLAMLVVASHWAPLLFNECEVMSWCVQVSVGLCDVCWLFLSVLTCLRCFSFVSTWHNFFIRTSDTIGIFKYIIQMRFLCASVVHLKTLFRVVWLSNSTSFSYTSHPLSRSEKKVIYCSLASD